MALNCVMRQKGFVFLLFIIIVILLTVVGYITYQKIVINKNDNNLPGNTNINLVTNLPNPTPTTSLCKKAGESICINPLICPENTDKCCKGLYAIIETRSNARCEIPNISNSNEPRVQSLEQ